MDQKLLVQTWISKLQDRICNIFEQIEQEFSSTDTPSRFEEKIWTREEGGGGGRMRVMRGKVFEKVGVNISVVHGNFSPEMCKEIPGTETSPKFFACGISLVTHMLSPKIPTIHMNTRYIETAKSWFGGGIDLTPTIQFQEDNDYFKQQLKTMCDRHDPSFYAKFSKECDEYFYIKHWKEPRGIGGIFYDYLNRNDFNKDFAFMRDVGDAFVEIYPKIVRNHLNDPWNEQDKLAQLKKRARYVEFNLLYDRGTRFGFMTNGNPEAILVSMPPLAHW